MAVESILLSILVTAHCAIKGSGKFHGVAICLSAKSTVPVANIAQRPLDRNEDGGIIHRQRLFFKRRVGRDGLDSGSKVVECTAVSALVLYQYKQL